MHIESVHVESVLDVDVELELQEAANTTKAKINNAFFIYLVANLRLELRTLGYEPNMLPLH